MWTDSNSAGVRTSRTRRGDLVSSHSRRPAASTRVRCTCLEVTWSPSRLAAFGLSQTTLGGILQEPPRVAGHSTTLGGEDAGTANRGGADAAEPSERLRVVRDRCKTCCLPDPCRPPQPRLAGEDVCLWAAEGGARTVRM